jgi:tyrosine 3-monooxygenase
MFVVYPSDAELTEEEMILANAASESKEAEQTIQKAALVLRMREGIGSLARILKTIEVSSTMRCHVSHELISVAEVPTPFTF